MKVNNPSVNSNQPQTETSSTSKAKEAAKNSRSRETLKSPGGPDPGAVSSDISSRAKEMAVAKSIASGTDEVREAKIAELKRKIANKEYNVKAEAVADRLVDEHLQTRDMG